MPFSIDLEDAVPADRKPAAREAVRGFLASDAALASGKLIIVRVNALGSPHFEADVQAVVGPALAMVNLPKPESAQDVRAAVAALEHAQALRGAGGGVRLLANIETPRALRHAAEIAAAHRGSGACNWAWATCSSPMASSAGRRRTCMRRCSPWPWRRREAGVVACDGAFADVQDEAGFRAEAAMSKALGFVGKSCIHPSQIAAANEIYQPDAAQLLHAGRVVAAAAEAQAQGRAAFLVDGKMIDPPFLARARQLLALASSRK